MKPVLTADEFRRVDQGYTGDLDAAMDRAGYAVALAATRNGAGYGKRVVVLAGPGNNGGDGYVAARYLRGRGVHVSVHALGPPKTPEAGRAAALAVAAGVRVEDLGPPQRADLVIDALFGGGMRGGIPPEVAAWMDLDAPVVAVDYPTGLDPNSGLVEEKAFRAVETVTFHAVKSGHLRGVGPEHCGRLTVAEIGIAGGIPSMWIAEEADAPRPTRPRKAHKWSAGAVLVVGGSTGMVGAAVFAGRGALRFGAGSVAVASPRPDLISAAAPDLVALSFDQAKERLGRFDVVVAGPGLAGPDSDPVVTLIEESGQTVLDAGGLDPRLVDAAGGGSAGMVLTPHAGEFRALVGVEAGTYAARAYAAKAGATVLLKGNPTLITDGALPILVRTGGPELASIGTGDVLAGMVAALWARGLDPTTSAVSAAYWHGVSGADLARYGTVTAVDLVGQIGRYAWEPGQ